jgi:hypothetical protein
MRFKGHDFFLILKIDLIFKLNYEGILGKKKLKWWNCNNLEVWGVKCHILNIEGQSANGLIVQEGKVYFSLIYIM